MATATAGVHIFGVRHLSPGGAWHLRAFLDAVKPTAVLIEGIADATSLIHDIVAPKTKPPLAVLAYTDSLPVASIITPFAAYSPEYQALRWAAKHEVETRFIDLPSGIFLALQRERSVAAKTENDDAPTPEEASEDASPAPSLFESIAHLAGEPDYDTWWERRFEHNSQPESYRLAAATFGRELRRQRTDDAETLLREAHMRCEITRAIADGHDPARIVVVVGAAHVPALEEGWAHGDDAALVAAAPTVTALLTLMPYSYFKLSSQSGYGAGNRAPAYHELLWEAWNTERDTVAVTYLADIARSMRRAGTHRSAAEVIEGTRLAEGLAALRGGSAPTLGELHDAAITLFGRGEIGPVAEAIARVDVGTRIGTLAGGTTQTSIQEDFQLQLKELRLDVYRTAVRQDLRLDLRENRRAKTAAAAWLDLRRSAFLHRLRALNIPFAEYRGGDSQQSSWAENWALQWTPECEIALVESILLGERIDVAAGYALTRRIGEAQDVAAAAAVVRCAGECDLPSVIQQARARVQALAAEATVVPPMAQAAAELGTIIRFGDVRRLDPAPLRPLLQQLHLQATLQLFHAAVCDHPTATALVAAISTLEALAQEHHDLVDEQRWLTSLRNLADADDRNSLVSGFACALLCERGAIDDADLGIEVSRRLSPGVPADIGAGWFEGLAARNRYALLSRLGLWERLDAYLGDLDAEAFPRALVFLRRAFGGFAPGERRAIAENLGQIWGVGADAASEAIHQPLNEQEAGQLGQLDDFDFEDL